VVADPVTHQACIICHVGRPLWQWPGSCRRPGPGSQLPWLRAAANRALEIRTAVQDYRCAQTVKLVATIKALQTRHARYVSKAIARKVARIIDVFAPALNEARRMHVTGQSCH
jgi:hypothetical protein